jgi:hypothetical protein
MDNWIPFIDGEYLVDRACLISAAHTAVALERVVVEVYSDRQGKRQLKGSGRVRNILVVELLEDHDELDLLLDFGEEFKYLLKRPQLQAGKVFAPDVKSALQFTPTAPWQQVSRKEFDELFSRLRFLDSQ